MAKFKKTVGFKGYERQMYDTDIKEGKVRKGINPKVMIPAVAGAFLIVIIFAVILLPKDAGDIANDIPISTKEGETYNPYDIFNLENGEETLPGYAQAATIIQQPQRDKESDNNNNSESKLPTSSKGKTTTENNNVSNRNNSANNDSGNNTVYSYSDDDEQGGDSGGRASGEIPVSNISVNYSSNSIEVGSGFTLSASVSPSNADNSTVYYSSNNSNVASVNGSGYVSGNSQGTAIITARAGNKTASCTVTVSEPYKPQPKYDLEISPSSMTISANTRLTLELTGTYSSVSWSVSNPGVAEILSQRGGIVTIRAKKSGVTNVIANTNNGQAKAKITVN